MGFSLKTARLAVLLAGFLLAGAGQAFAVFELEVAPRRGGQHLRFEESQPGGLLRNEEVTITVESDVATQYRILQTVYQPLINESGNTMPQGAFIEFSPSTPLGTLRTQLETPVAMGQSQIFTSNAAGDSDTFVLVFNVRVPEDLPGGLYRTQIIFTAEPVTPVAGVTQRVVTMDVQMEIRPTFRMTVSGRGGTHELDLGRISKDRGTAAGELALDLESNIGTTYRVLEQLAQPLASASGGMLDEGALSVAIAGGTNGQPGPPSPQPVALSPAVIYTSNGAGQGDSLRLDYVFEPGQEEKSGIYTGVLTFRVESSSPLVSPEVISVPVRVEIEPIFDLDVQLKEGTSLHFGQFGAESGEGKRSVTLTVKSNLGEPYNVSQVVSRKLTNEKGTSLPAENFLFQGKDAKTGTLAAPSPKPVLEGESVLFTSDRKGTPEEFAVDYILDIPQGSQAGSYSSEIKYSLTTL
ncbi:MAG TPA: hypothetical protein VL404_03270 [Candidatus Eisenbacteria bacterium]|nr:hypothetical protein [Candidatus Eisenbacteria bacterium]